MQYKPATANQAQGVPTRRPDTEEPDIVDAARNRRPADPISGEYDMDRQARDEEIGVDSPMTKEESPRERS